MLPEVFARTTVQIHYTSFYYICQTKYTGMKNKVYIVTSGEYSDYSIERVFSTLKQAREYCDRFGDDHRVETFILDEDLPPRKESLYTVEMRIGTKKPEEVLIQPDEQDGTVRVVPTFNTILFGVKTDSRTRAIKIASERYDQVFALESTKYPYLRANIVRRLCVLEPPTYDFLSGDIILGTGELAVELPSHIKVRRPAAVTVALNPKAQAAAQELADVLKRANEQLLLSVAKDAARIAKRTAKRVSKETGDLGAYIAEKMASVPPGMELKNIKKEQNSFKLEFDNPGE